MFHGNYEILSVDSCPYRGKSWQVAYLERSNYIAIEHVCTNVHNAAFATSLTRMKLYSVLGQLQERVLYYNTDFIIFKTAAEQSPLDPQRGDYLGNVTDELPSDRHIVEFETTCP